MSITKEAFFDDLLKKRTKGFVVMLINTLYKYIDNM